MNSSEQMTSADGENARLYLFVRRDLPWSTRVVQAAHAASMLTYHSTPAARAGWDPQFGPPFVVYGVPDEAELVTWCARLGVQALPYYEPDRAGEMTALAFYGAGREEFKSMRLL